MDIHSYTVEPLSWDAAVALAPTIREDDAYECGLMGHSVKEALASGGMMGTAYIGFLDGRPRGSFGWTEEGTIWSLWSPLDVASSRLVLRETPKWVRKMVKDSGRPYLFNYIPQQSLLTQAWLRASGCFQIDAQPSGLHQGVPLVYFRTIDNLDRGLN